MIIFSGGILIGLLLVGLAIADVFWPLTIILAASLGAAWWMANLDLIWKYIHLSPMYFVAGFVWVFFKWTRLVDRELDQAKRFHKKSPTIPKWSSHSYVFSAYFFYWPIDMLAYILSDLLSDAWEWISNMVSRSFDRYAEWRFKELDKS